MAKPPYDQADDAEFVEIPGVAVLDEHETADPDTGKPLRVDAARLAEIAKNQNARVAETGNETVICLGHTRDDPGPETAAPPVVGFARDFYVGPFLDTDRQALFCTFRLYRDRADEVLRNYPNRSVELWTKRWAIEPIALLSSTAPERDLGLLRRDRDPAEPVRRYTAARDPAEPAYRYRLPTPLPAPSPVPMPTRYARPDTDADDAPDAETDAVARETSSYKGLEAKIDALTEMLQPLVEALTHAMSGDPHEGDPHEGDPHEGDPHEDGPPEGGPPGGGPPPGDRQARKDHEPPPVKFEEGGGGGPAAASGTNAYTPGTPKDKKKMSRDETAIRYEREVAALRSEVSTLRARDRDQAVRLQRLRAEKVASELEAEGVDFGTPRERAEEIDLLAELNDEAFDFHVGRVRRQFKRKPVPGAGLGEVLRYGRGADVPAGEPTDMAEARRVADQMAAGKTYEEALAALRTRK